MKTIIKTLAWCAPAILPLVFVLGMFGVRITYAPERSIDWTATATIFSALATVVVGAVAAYIAYQNNEQSKKMDEHFHEEKLMMDEHFHKEKLMMDEHLHKEKLMMDEHLHKEKLMMDEHLHKEKMMMGELARKERLMDEVRKTVDNVNHVLSLGILYANMDKFYMRPLDEAKKILISQLTLFDIFCFSKKQYLSDKGVSELDCHYFTFVRNTAQTMQTIFTAETKTFDNAFKQWDKKKLTAIFMEGNNYLRTAEAKIFGE